MDPPKIIIRVTLDFQVVPIFRTIVIAVGTTQRFGIPLWLGGPHAAYFATRDKFKRLIPGRIVGKTIDSNGTECFRLALQTREQHIKRDKATSNVCTAQALLANGAAFYAIYHGPHGLKKRASALHFYAKIIAEQCQQVGLKVEHSHFFETLKISTDNLDQKSKILERAKASRINLRKYPNELSVGVALNDLNTVDNINTLLYCLTDREFVISKLENSNDLDTKYFEFSDSSLVRTSPFMTQAVFNSYHSETAFARYAEKLVKKDLSLVSDMIPLGSCTMKLNSSTSLDCMTIPGYSNVHPLASSEQVKGWKDLLEELQVILQHYTGFDYVFLQPNSGAQGELAGLATIKAYHEYNGDGDKRKIILIPISAHGTNPASANLCGYTVKQIKVRENGRINSDHLNEQIEKYKDQLAGCMITYPSTYGIFEETIKDTCDKIHAAGGQVYLDGANMNAQLGICRPGDYGADVCHLNLHKTFSGPHGGGGPGAGPIGVKSHLIPFLPDNPLNPKIDIYTNVPEKLKSLSRGALASTPEGSPIVLVISYIYAKMVGARGMREASLVSILNANYMMKRLENHFDCVFTDKDGYNAHEFIIDLRNFKEKSGVTALDVCKRLQDYGLQLWGFEYFDILGC